ncbi:MAG TPA: ATP-binding protein [Gemmatimonadales bacterium]|nr:ATP-binding protein [Gemmatimonadales bacterium]
MRPRRLGWVVWVGLAGATTLLLLTLRGRLDKAHVVLVYLLLVLGGSAAGGRRLGLLLAGAAFLLFNWFFVPPYGTFAVADPFDWLVLIAFLIVSAVTAQMVHRLQGEAEAARRRADEVDSLAVHAEALREADRLKDALLASVSHDLRTPLTTIKALAHQLWDQGDERALAIVEEADRMNRLVADLLDLSRLKSGAMQVAVELTAVDDLVGAVVQRVSGALSGREFRVSLAEGGTLLVGRFDLVHALHILINLVENAHKYSPAGSPIELAVDVRADHLTFAVSDRGPGIAPAEQERIFEPFYRPPGTPPDVGGSGLGLTIARKLAEAQSGTLAYEPREGGGSRFLLSLPAAELPTAGEFP